MATRGVSMTIHYVAVDATTNMGKTGDAANHTLRWIKDGTPLVPTNSPVEVDATNCPGIYKLTLTASETDCNIGTLGGKSSTANVSIIPKTIEFERLPDAAPGASGGVPVIGQPPLTNLDTAVSSRADATYYTSARAVKLDNLDAAVSTRATASSVWGHSSRSLTTAVDVNMSQSLPSSPGANTVGEALKFADTRLDATVSSRATAANVWEYTTRELTGPVNLNMGQEAPPNPIANTVGDAIKSSARMRFTESDDVYAWAVNESGGGGGGGAVEIEMTQAVPTNPISGTVGDAMRKAILSAAQSDVTAIRQKTDRLRFTEDDLVKAQAEVQVTDIEVLVQPLNARVLTPDGDGGTLTFWAAAKMRASWYLDQDVSGHDLAFLIYAASDPNTALAECRGDEITTTAQEKGCLVALEASEQKLPPPGAYRFVLRDQTTDSVLLSGAVRVVAAPDAS